jgi:hypothetical protein
MAKGRFRNIFGAKQLPLKNSNKNRAGEASRAVRQPAPVGAEMRQAIAEIAPS